MSSHAIAALMAGFLMVDPRHLVEARAGCAAQEKGEIKRLLPGSWRQYIDDNRMCVVETFARHGGLIKTGSNCGGGTGFNGASEGSWRIDNDCQVIETIDGKEDKFKVDFVDDNKWIVRGCPSCLLAAHLSYRGSSSAVDLNKSERSTA